MQANREDRSKKHDGLGLLAVGVGAAAVIGAVGYGLYSLFNANSDTTEQPQSYERPQARVNRRRNESVIPCSICLEDLDENARELKCGHAYHRECINQWFARGSEDRSCPYCRYKDNSL